jgi:hypothetical protein
MFDGWLPGTVPTRHRTAKWMHILPIREGALAAAVSLPEESDIARLLCVARHST